MTSVTIIELKIYRKFYYLPLYRFKDKTFFFYIYKIFELVQWQRNFIRHVSVSLELLSAKQNKILYDENVCVKNAVM